MLVPFFGFINFSHLRTRASTRALTPTHPPTHTHAKLFRKRSKRCHPGGCWVPGWTLQHIHLDLPGAQHRNYAFSSEAKVGEGFPLQLLCPQCRSPVGIGMPPPLSSPAAASLSTLPCEDKTFLLARSYSLKFALKSGKFDSVPYLSAR